MFHGRWLWWTELCPPRLKISWGLHSPLHTSESSLISKQGCCVDNQLRRHCSWEGWAANAMPGVLVRKGTMASEHVPQGCYVKTCTETEAMWLQAKDCQRLLRTTTGQEGREKGGKGCPLWVWKGAGPTPLGWLDKATELWSGKILLFLVT